MAIFKPMKSQEKSLTPVPGFIVAGTMTTNDDFRRPFRTSFVLNQWLGVKKAA